MLLQINHKDSHKNKNDKLWVQKTGCFHIISIFRADSKL